MIRVPLMIELFAGCFGWSAGWLSLGGRAIGFDIEHLPHHGPVPDGADLVLQDVLTLSGHQFRDADLILASPPCQAYSYRAMPWKRAKALPPPDNSLFEACFRIQREASEAAGRYIPMVVENVNGAQPWVGRAKWHYGSFYLWGDVPALMPFTSNGRMKYQADCGPRMWKDREVARLNDAVKVPGLNWSGSDKPGYKAKAFNTTAVVRLRDHSKNNGGSWFNIAHNTESGTGQNPDDRSIKGTGGSWFTPDNLMLKHSSGSPARKAASAQIARIPYPLSLWIAQCYWPDGVPQQGDTRLQTCGEA